MMWAAATTDGLMLYSQEEQMLFDPIDLDIHITPQSIRKTLADKSYSKALVMAIKLNDPSMIRTVVETVPPEQISLCVEALSPRYFETMLCTLSENVETTQYLHFYLLWINKLCIIHGRYLKSNFTKYLPYLRLIQKALSSLYKDLAPICNGNRDRLDFLASFGGAGKQKKAERKRIKFEVVEQEKVVRKPTGNFEPVAMQPVPEKK